MTSTHTDTTHALATFVAGLGYDGLPHDVVARVKRQCLDVLGVGLAGATQPTGAIAAAFASRQRSAPESTVWGTAVRASPPDSAFANGIAAHALDFDDIWLPGAHPTAPIFSAAFAVAESLGSSGQDLLAAQTAGYEVMGRLHAAGQGRAGWHPTGVFGAFGAAAACAKLLGLDAAGVATAWGIASCQASGIDGHEGTMSKPFNAGQAARSGVVAALLASEGFTASTRVFDSPRGVFDAFYRELPYQPWRVTAGLGDTFYVLSPGIGLKLHPAGYLIHHAFEAALRLVSEHDLHPDDIEEVVVGVRPGSPFDRPAVTTGLQGKFSLQYIVTMAIVDRGLDIESFSDERVRSSAVQAVLQRVRTVVDNTIPDNLDITYNPVTIRLRDGTAHTTSEPLPTSHWRHPLAAEQWLEKFRRSAARVLASEQVEELRCTVERIEHVADARTVGALLAAA